MARTNKSSALKVKAKASAAKAKAPTKATSGKKPKMRLVDGSGEPAVGKQAPAKATEPASAKMSASKVSQKLIETIERRKKEAKQNHPFSRPAGRRGRRPKAMAEYVPGNSEEETYSYDADSEGLEYDTGIRVKEKSEDGAFAMERFEEFDEELNFDW